MGRRTFGRAGGQKIPGAWSRAPFEDGRPFLHANRPRHPKAYDAYEEDFDVRLASGEVYHADSMPLIDSLKYHPRA